MRYRYNPACSCARCRAHGFMGPAVLITLGILFLLDQMTHIYWMEFGRTWPVLLIVIGLIMFLQYTAPATGHVPREYMAMQQAQGQYQAQQPQQWRPPVTTPPAPNQAPTPSAGTTDQGEVHNG
jgi:cell wall-active antibiotic response 4TMS protein YvqF